MSQPFVVVGQPPTRPAASIAYPYYDSCPRPQTDTSVALLLYRADRASARGLTQQVRPLTRGGKNSRFYYPEAIEPSVDKLTQQLIEEFQKKTKRSISKF